MKDIVTESYADQLRKEIFSQAQKLLLESMPELTEELFSLFETNGDRINYEKEYFTRRKFLAVYGMAVLIGKEEKNVTTVYVQKLEEVLLDICHEECWEVPAHVFRTDNPNWRNTVALFPEKKY